MDTFLIGQFTFWYSSYKINPSSIVDFLIKTSLDLIVPGRGASDNSWWMKPLRTIEQTTERASREMDIRNNLRRWDQEHPELHHELIVRTVAASFLSFLVTNFYVDMCRRIRSTRRY